jgi:hypothetical protein
MRPKWILIAVFIATTGELPAQTLAAVPPAEEHLPPPQPDWIKGQVPNYGGAIQFYLNMGRINTLHDVFPPFGGSFLRPIAHGRVELFGGAAGIYVPFASVLTRQNSWLTQASVGARVSLDTSRRFWIGTTSWYLVDFADQKRQRAFQSADFTFRFGH